MNDIVIALFTGPATAADHALNVAERAGFCATRLRAARSDAAFVELLDVLTDDTVDATRWANHTTATAASIMASLGFELASLRSPRLA